MLFLFISIRMISFFIKVIPDSLAKANLNFARFYAIIKSCFYTKGALSMRIQESGEMYLETILILLNKNSQVRAIDIVNYTGYTKPSISRAIGLLRSDKFLEVDSHGYITLTEYGEETAKRIYERHVLLTEFLIHLGVDEKVAAEDACKIEHDISNETFEKIKAHARSGKENHH